MSCISLKVLVVSTLFNLLVMPFSSALAIVFGYIALLSSVLLPIELMLYNGNCINKKQLKIIFAFAIIMCLNSIISLTKIQSSEFENVIKALISFFTFFLTISMKGLKYTERDLRFYFSVIRFFSVILVLYTIIPFEFQYDLVNSYGEKQFTLSMGNPNATATKILFAIIVLCSENGVLKNKYLRRFNIVLIAGLLYTILRLRSRTALICAIVFIICGVILKLKVKKWVANWVWVIPIAFIPIQLALARFPSLEWLDKALASGRETLFADFIELISTSPTHFIFGNFVENQLENSHNIIFTLLFNIGIFGLILFLWFWKIETRDIGEAATKISRYAWMGWVVFVIHSMAEAAAFSGAFTYGVILILLNRMVKDKLVISSGFGSDYDFEFNDIYLEEGDVE